jgi:hypothetical protein
MRKSTASIQFLGGVPCTVPNRTNDVETGSPHWYVSYNNHDIAIHGSDTTALVLGQGEYFLILNGDHREGLRKAIEFDDKCRTSRLHRCLNYVRENRDKLGKYSNPII